MPRLQVISAASKGGAGGGVTSFEPGYPNRTDVRNDRQGGGGNGRGPLDGVGRDDQPNGRSVEDEEFRTNRRINDDDDDDDDGNDGEGDGRNCHDKGEGEVGGEEDNDNNEGEGEEKEEGDRILFSCRCESAKSVVALLSCLRSVSSSSSPSSAYAFSSSAPSYSHSRASELGGILTASDDRRVGSARAQHATVVVGKDALVVYVRGSGGQSQASVDMEAGLFSDYFVGKQVVPILDDNEEEDLTPTSQQFSRPKTEIIYGGDFGINLTTVLECLHVLGSASLDRTKLCLSYDNHDDILKIELLENGAMDGAGGEGEGAGAGVLSTCAVPGLAVPDDEGGDSSLAVAFRSSAIVARAILKSDYLRDAIDELKEVPGATSAIVAVGPGGVEFFAVGHSSECHVSLPHSAENAEVYVSLVCDPPRLHARSYPLHSILSAMRGLEIGSETSININSRGMIAIQHMVHDFVGSGKPNYIDFFMGCLLDEEEEGNEDLEGENEPEVELDPCLVNNSNQRLERSPEVVDRISSSKKAPRVIANTDTNTSPLMNSDSTRDEESDSDGKKSAGNVDNGEHLFGMVGEVEYRPPRKKTYRRSGKERRAGRLGKARSDSRSRSSSPPPLRQDGSQRQNSQSSNNGESGDSGFELVRKRVALPKDVENMAVHPRRRKRVDFSGRNDHDRASGHCGNPDDSALLEGSDQSSEEAGGGGSEKESQELGGSLDVTATPSRMVKTTDLGRKRDGRHMDEEPPSSPELMYGDTKLEGHSQRSDAANGNYGLSSTNLSLDKGLSRRTRRLPRFAAKRNRTRYNDSAEESDDGEGF